LRGLGDGVFIVVVQLAQQRAPGAPHLGVEAVVLAVARGYRRRAGNVLAQAEAEPVALDFHPDVAARVARAPLEDDAGVVILEPAAPLQRVPVQHAQHLADAALADHALGILADGLPLRLGLGSRLLRRCDIVGRGILSHSARRSPVSRWLRRWPCQTMARRAALLSLG